MSYQLGVDLGTTYTAAAVSRNGRLEVCSLGTSGPVIPSVVVLRADGEVLVGEVAVRRGLEEPTRVAREFKRRLGDPTPLVLGGTPYGAESLMSHLLRAVVKLVSQREGSAPDRVVLTHPANYGPYKLDMMREVARLAGLDLSTTSFVTEPEAAAISYATRNRVEPGNVVAVYDFGGGTFDAAMLQRTDEGFALLGRPEGMERFGGIDIDAAILAHVDQLLDGRIRAMDPDDPDVQSSVARLKDDCREAKEALSNDTDTSIDVSLPGIRTRVRLTRRELEDMIRPRLKETVEALDRAVRTAGLTLDRVSRILLVGGSSRMPLVAETIQRETGRPVAVDAHPKFAIAFGAAAFGQDSQLTSLTVVPPPTGQVPLTVPAPAPPSPQLTVAAQPAMSPPPPPPPVHPVGPPTGQTERVPMSPTSPAAPSTPAQFQAGPPPAPGDATKRKKLIGAGIAGVVLVGGIAAFAMRGSDASTTAPNKTDETTPSVAEATTAEEVSPTTLPSTTAPVVTVPITVPITVSITLPKIIAAPTTIIPVTAPPAQPLTLDQLNFAVIQPSEIATDWVAGTFQESPPTPVCGQTFQDSFLTVAGAVFTRTRAGQQQQLVNQVSTYADTASANATFNAFRNSAGSCTEFDSTDSSGNPIKIAIQSVDETPQPGCQAGFDIRLDGFVTATGAPLVSTFFLLQVCGNNASSVTLTIPPTSGALPPDLLQEIGVALQTSLTKLRTFPVVP